MRPVKAGAADWALSGLVARRQGWAAPRRRRASRPVRGPSARATRKTAVSTRTIVAPLADVRASSSAYRPTIGPTTPTHDRQQHQPAEPHGQELGGRRRRHEHGDDEDDPDRLEADDDGQRDEAEEQVVERRRPAARTRAAAERVERRVEELLPEDDDDDQDEPAQDASADQVRRR